MEAAVVVTYRCNANCHMCNTWQFPRDLEDEITPRRPAYSPRISSSPTSPAESLSCATDIEEIVEVVAPKADRVVISTNGYFTDRVVALAKTYP